VSVDRIGLGELTRGLGEVSHLSRVGDDDRDLGGCEGRGGGNLKAACGLPVTHERSRSSLRLTTR